MMTVIKSLWTTPISGEDGAPKNRIIHAKTVRFTGKSKNVRIGLREGQGFFKCGSDKSIDAVRDIDIYIEKNGRLELYKSLRDINVESRECEWINIESETNAVSVVVRRSRVDGWWSCYNITRDGIAVEADEPETDIARRNLLKAEPLEQSDIEGIETRENSVAVCYKTAFYKLALRKKSVGLYGFSCDSEGKGNLNTLLSEHVLMNFDDNSDYTAQGPLLYPLDGGAPCNLYSIPLKGKTQIGSNNLCYDLQYTEAGLSYKLSFTMLPDKIKLKVEGEAERESYWSVFSLFRMSFNTEVTPPTLLAEPQKSGETGLVSFDDNNKAILHFPRFGSIMCKGKDLGLRMISVRDKTCNVLDLVLPGLDQPDGSVRLQKGHFEGELELDFNVDLPRKVREDAPKAIRKAVEKFELTALPFRMDTTTFSNNGNSNSAPICMDLWADICVSIGDNGFPKVSQMLKNTLELWMLGVPAYASGWVNDRSHLFEDEYLMTAAATLTGLGSYLCNFSDKEWFDEYRSTIIEKLEQEEKRVEDNDGIPVSHYRRGISGERQWSTSWYDVISYGGKDALSTVILYKGLLLLEKGFKRFGDIDTAEKCGKWADTVKANFWNIFGTANGWVAGWRSTDNELHDYGFLAVNGMAAECGLIPEDKRRNAIEKLWNALLDTGFDNFDVGLPGNVFCVPKADMAFVQSLYPFGGYENAGVTLSQSCHFIRGMLAVGMRDEACALLQKMAEGMCDGINIGGVGSGLDWQTWDGVPCGYEGYLCDQMGVIAVMLEIWGE